MSSLQGFPGPEPGLIRCSLAFGGILLLVACSRIGSPAAKSPAPGSQGIHGRFEALGGAQPPDPGCENLASPTQRDSCEREFLSQTLWPLQGFAVIHDAKGDSLILKLDSLGGYRSELPPGLYTVCAWADGIGLPESCQDSIEVNPGRFTPYSRPFPLP